MGDDVPESDKETEFERSLLYDQGKVRTVDDGEYFRLFRSGKGVYLPTVRIHTWDGKRGSVLTEWENEAPSGIITNVMGNCVGDPQFTWILDAMCIDYSSSINLKQYHLAKNSSQNNSDYIALLKHGEQPRHNAEIWVQAKPPYLLKKTIRKYNGAPISWTEFNYQTDLETGRNIPKSSRSVYLNEDRTPFMTIESEVFQVNLKPKTSPADFQIDFPVGTMTTDNRTSPPRNFIVQ